MPQNSVWGALIGSIVRWALAAIFGGLVMKGIIDQATLDRLLTEGVALIVTAILGVGVPLLWSWYAKVVAKVREKSALEVSPGPGAVAEVTKKTAETPLPEKISIAIKGGAA